MAGFWASLALRQHTMALASRGESEPNERESMVHFRTKKRNGWSAICEISQLQSQPGQTKHFWKVQPASTSIGKHQQLSNPVKHICWILWAPSRICTFCACTCPANNIDRLKQCLFGMYSMCSNQPKSKPQILCLQVTLASAESAKVRSPAQLADGHIWTFLADLKTQDTQPGSGQIATDLQDPTSLWVKQCETWSSRDTLRLKIHQAFPISRCHMIQHKPCTPPCQGGTWEHWCSSCPAPGRSGPWAIRSLG